MNKTIRVLLFGAIAGTMISCASQKDQSNNDQRQGGPPSFAQLLSEMDANKDGMLSKSEVTGPLANDFSKFDSDNDGLITKSEFESAAKAPRGGRGPR